MRYLWTRICRNPGYLLGAIAAAAIWAMSAGCGGGTGAVPVAITQSTATESAVESITPSDGAAEVSTAAKIAVIFKTDIDPGTINNATFGVTGPGGAVSGTASYDPATRTATFSPLMPLRTQTSYTATISSAVRTRQGLALATPVISVFRTSATRDLTVSGDAPLRARAAAKGLIYGCAGTQSKLSDPGFAAAFGSECGILTPEGALKWNALRPSENSYDFAQADWHLGFAERNNMLFRGHTLVWSEALPAWFQGTVNPGNAEGILRDHIATVVGRYAGRIHSWDVVNEAIAVGQGDPNGLRTASPWYRLLGPRYIDIAFRAAAEADPKALLVLNEFDLDYDTPAAEAKRAAVLHLLGSLKASGTPVHALGFQAHLSGSETRFSPEKLRSFFSQVAALGLKVMITEMDVTDQGLPADAATRDRMVAGVYDDFLSVALKETAVISIQTWGLSDRYTWLTLHAPRGDGLPTRPLPLDDGFHRKLAWSAVAKAIDGASSR